jgi:hypothetical protein
VGLDAGTAIAAFFPTAQFVWRRYGEAAAMASESGGQARVHPAMGVPIPVLFVIFLLRGCN